MQRGRGHGLPSYTAMRATLGLSGPLPIASDILANLMAIYGDADEIDLYIGSLAETHLDGAMLGELFHTILSDQFLRLRDGDRFFYQKPDMFDDAVTAWLYGVTLADIVRYNTSYDLAEGTNMFSLEPASAPQVPLPASGLMLLALAPVALALARKRRAGRRGGVGGGTWYPANSTELNTAIGSDRPHLSASFI